MKKLLVFSFIFFFIIYFVSSAGKTPYDYFTRLGYSFLQGKFWLDENPPWLSELIPAGGRYYVVYPPMPAILSVPFIFLFGKNFPQESLGFLLGAGVVVLTMIISWKIKKDKILAIWSGLLIGLGSIAWYLSATGSSWYLGQITSLFFQLAALVEILDKKRPFKIGVFLGASFLSRINTIVSLPFFLYLLKDRQKLVKNFFLLVAGTIPFILFYAVYNFLRFGKPWENGYFLLPSVLNETSAPWFVRGVISPYYILDNLKVMLWSFPKILSHFPYIQPSWAGLAIWITTPAFIFALKAPLKETVVKISWLVVAANFLVVAMHGGTGFAQFGYRFAVDFYPYLTFLTIKGVAKIGLKWYHWAFLAFGILVNLWGILWINKFGWIGY